MNPFRWRRIRMTWILQWCLITSNTTTGRMHGTHIGNTVLISTSDRSFLSRDGSDDVSRLCSCWAAQWECAQRWHSSLCIETSYTYSVSTGESITLKPRCPIVSNDSAVFFLTHEQIKRVLEHIFVAWTGLLNDHLRVKDNVATEQKEPAILRKPPSQQSDLLLLPQPLPLQSC